LLFTRVNVTCFAPRGRSSLGVDSAAGNIRLRLDEQEAVPSDEDLLDSHGRSLA
jgi:hypothetical protein